MSRTKLAAVLWATLALGAAGCVYSDPHLRAWHDRPRYVDGIELIFDSELDCHRVAGYYDHYYYRGQFLRYGDGEWYAGANIHGPWLVIEIRELPSRLRRHRHHR